MNEKIFIAPRLTGSRFEDHTLPVNILEDFTAFEELIIELAKGIYLDENPNRKRVPKGFSDGIYLKLSKIDEGSSVPNFIIASILSLNPSLPFENLESFSYFEKAKEKVIEIVQSVNEGIQPTNIDHKYLNYFNKIGKNLLDNEAIDFGYNLDTKTESKAILNKVIRKKILLSREEKLEYSDNIKVNALIPAINQKDNKFSIEFDGSTIECDLKDNLRDTIFSAFNEYNSNTYVSVKATGIYNWNDKIVRIEDIESMDILDPFDVSVRINTLAKLQDKWLEGKGLAPKKDSLFRFNDLFNSYYDNKLPLPAIFPTGEGNIQLEWKKDYNNIIIEINLESFDSTFFYYNDKNDDEKEQTIVLNSKENWNSLNKLIETYI
jgi:hypothetical protein